MDHLPPENFIQIFSYLAHKDLENAASVCKRWREVIINSPEIMNHVCKFIFGRHDIVSKDFALNLPYKNLFIDCTIFKIVYRLSSDFSILRQLTIVETPIEFLESKEFSQLSMPHLKILELDYASEDLLLVIHCENVEKFAFTVDRFGASEFDKTLKPFFDSNCDLKYVRFDYGFPRFEMASYKFKLQFLIIYDAYDLPSHFIEFLKAQKSSLQELILRVFKVDEPVLNYIYFEMNLTKLLDNHWNRIELKKKFNKSVKSLALSNSMLTPRDVVLIQQIILRCHALDFLRIELSSLRPRQTLKFLSSLVPRLKFLALSTSIKHLKLISKWIKSNGYHVSLSSTFFNEGLNSLSERIVTNGMLFIISSGENVSNFHQFGKVMNVNAFHQISQENPGENVEFKNLENHKQDKKAKKNLQIRIFIRNMIITPWCDEKNIFLNFSPFNQYDYEIDD